MINLKFIEIDTNPSKPKATVHASGRLGFNAEAIIYMNLSEKRNFRVAVSGEEEVGAKVIYLIEDDATSGTAKVSKAGDYYYLNVGTLFDDLSIEYKEFTIIFDIKKHLYDEKDMFVLKMRKPRKKNKKEDNQDY